MNIEHIEHVLGEVGRHCQTAVAEYACCRVEALVHLIGVMLFYSPFFFTVVWVLWSDWGHVRP